QDEEGGLEGVLRVRLVAQHPAADAQDHRAVPPHQRLEGGLVPPREESLQEFRVVQVSTTPQPSAPDAADDNVHLAGWHGVPSLPVNLLFLLTISRRPAVCYTSFAVQLTSERGGTRPGGREVLSDRKGCPMFRYDRVLTAPSRVELERALGDAAKAA